MRLEEVLRDLICTTSPTSFGICVLEDTFCRNYRIEDPIGARFGALCEHFLATVVFCFQSPILGRFGVCFGKGPAAGAGSLEP